MTVPRGDEEVGGLRCAVVTVGEAATRAVILLHGWAMRPEDLEPFARSIGVDATFYLPRGPAPAPGATFGWWDVDEEHRAAAIAIGPRDLSVESPPGARPARAALAQLWRAVAARHRANVVAIVGFSQGGMLACEATLFGEVAPDGLALLSSSRINATEWESRGAVLEGLPLLVSHGRADHDLSFAAGESLLEFVKRSGAQATWVPFDGGHEIPLLVWRALKRFLLALTPRVGPSAP